MLDEFLTYLTTEKRVSVHTVTAYSKDIQSFLDFVLVTNAAELKEINYQNIRGWMVELINENHSNRTVNRKLSSLRTFFKWAMMNQLITVDPMLRIKGPKQEKRLPEFVKQEELTPEKMEDLFPNTFSGLRDRLMIELFYQTGIRLAELINLKRGDLTNENIKVLGKRNKERLVPITPELIKLFTAYLQSETYKNAGVEYIFITDSGRRMYPKFVYRKVKFYLSMMTNLKKRSPHVLRHTFATHMLNNGAGLETLKEILGHADLNATQIYTHNSFEQIAKIYKSAHPRGDKKK